MFLNFFLESFREHDEEGNFFKKKFTGFHFIIFVTSATTQCSEPNPTWTGRELRFASYVAGCTKAHWLASS